MPQTTRLASFGPVFEPGVGVLRVGVGVSPGVPQGYPCYSLPVTPNRGSDWCHGNYSNLFQAIEVRIVDRGRSLMHMNELAVLHCDYGSSE